MAAVELVTKIKLSFSVIRKIEPKFSVHKRHEIGNGVEGKFLQATILQISSGVISERYK